MKKLFKQIFPEFDEFPEGHRLRQLLVAIEEREDNLIKNLLETSKELLHFQKTKIPRCQICKKDFVKAGEYSWKPNCNCINKDLRMNIV